jgi:hypothetical protein
MGWVYLALLPLFGGGTPLTAHLWGVAGVLALHVACRRRLAAKCSSSKGLHLSQWSQAAGPLLQGSKEGDKGSRC